MAWDSAYTAQLMSGYQGMAMGNMAYAQQIGMGSGLSSMPGMASQQIMGGIMNRGYGIGAPLMTAGLGMMGLDPLSLGLKAGMSAWGGGAGLMGAGIAGMGVAGAAAGGLALAGYAGNQIMTGAQQQQSLNTALRGSFNFMNPMTGQQGFSSGQMSQIGGMMRHMTHNIGAGGEVTGMGELTQLAAGMGSMGMANGVRDVQEFGRKFREMVQTVKTIATEIGTSLQEAQQMMASMKGSGIFRTSDQLKYASTAKGAAFSGGLALSEVTAMGNIGAQISRSVGGLGRQGVFAGMNTIGQIGTATQMGILSEEDIYNATGLTGAEGRQALGTASLSHAANFLRGGKGRRMLASLASENGSLNEGAVQQLLSGGMSISETMRNSSQNLSRIGRANFIRNEGRLRGSALERLGGFLPAMQLREWAESKGVDINEMDDRSMLFAQRQLGMGRDEMDVAMRMAQRMPEILSQMRSSGEDQAFMDRLGQYRKTQGIEGIKNRFTQARERVQGTLQKIGQDIFNEGSEQIERVMNKIAGTYEERFSAEAANAYRQAGFGGASGSAAFEKYVGAAQRFGASANKTFGSVGNSSSFFAGYSGGLMGAISHEGMKVMGSNSRIAATGGLSFVAGGLYGLAAGGAGYLLRGESTAGQFKSAGYDMSSIEAITDQTKRDEALRARLSDIRQMGRVANEAPSSEYVAIGRSNAEWLQAAYANGSIHGSGEDRMLWFGKELLEKGDKGLQRQWLLADRDERIRMMTGARAGALGGSDPKAMAEAARAESSMFAAPGSSNFYFGSGLTKKEREERLAAAFLGKSAPPTLMGSVLQGAKWGAASGALIGGAGAIPGVIGGAVMGGVKYYAMDHGEEASAIGSFLDSEEATDIMSGIMSSDQKTRDETTRRVNRELASLADKKDLGHDEKGKQQALHGMLAAKEYDQALGPDGKIDERKLTEIAKRHNMRPEDIPRTHDVLMAAEGRKAQERALGLAHKLGDQATAEMGRLQAAGIARFDGNAVSIDKDFAKAAGLSKGGADYLKAMLRQTGYEGKMAGVSDADEAVNLERKAITERQRANEALQGMSVAEKRKLAQDLAKAGDFTHSGDVGGAAARQDMFQKNVGRKGIGGAVASALGVSLSKEEQAALKGMNFGTAKDQDSAAKLIAEKLGVGGDADVLKDIKASLSSAQEGSKGVAKGADLLAGVSGLKSVQDAQKKKREEAQGEKDPLMAKLVGIMEKMPKEIAAAIGNTTLNVKDMSKDPEGGTAPPK